MLFAADVSQTPPDELVKTYWAELGEADIEDAAREFATRLAIGTLVHTLELDERIRLRAEHWRIARMAIVDRNILRLAVYEFLFEPTPCTVAINEALEIARRFSTYEATQFINGILTRSSATWTSINRRKASIRRPNLLRRTTAGHRGRGE
jgi:N utilization substance protein B